MKAGHFTPKGFHSVTPYLIVEDAAGLLDFVQAAFGARVVSRMDGDDGRIKHAQIQIGDSMIEVGQSSQEWQAAPCALHLYVADTDDAYQRALAAGATSLYEPDDKFYGDREAGVTDVCGNRWFLATHQEDLTEAEMLRRMAAQ